MAAGRSAIVGFLFGVVLTLIATGLSAYYAYKTFERQISPETIRATAENQLTQLAGSPVSVGGAQINFPNLLVLDHLKIASATQTLVTVEKIEAIAEGGVQGLKEARFIELVVTKPIVSLDRAGGKWNAATFLAPILDRFAKGGKPSPSGATGEAIQTAKGPPPLKSILLKGLSLAITVDGKSTPSALEAGDVSLSRKDAKSPWNLVCKGGHLRLNNADGEWPLLEALTALQQLFNGKKASPVEQPEPREPAQPILAGVQLENITLELIQPAQLLTIEGLSLRADELFKMIEVQTGELEKKKSSQSNA
jgi:hypothetical protein